MTVAVIGTGKIGTALAGAFARAGLEVVFGTRKGGDPATAHDAVKLLSVADAVKGADVVVLALPGPAVVDFLTTHSAALHGTLVVDAANGSPGPVKHHAADVAEHAPGARYARAFNTYGVENLTDPQYHGVVGDQFFTCKAADQRTVEQLISAVGLRPVYLGPDQEDQLEAVTRLWFTLAAARGHGRHLAFKMLSA